MKPVSFRRCSNGLTSVTNPSWSCTRRSSTSTSTRNKLERFLRLSKKREWTRRLLLARVMRRILGCYVIYLVYSMAGPWGPIHVAGILSSGAGNGTGSQAEPSLSPGFALFPGKIGVFFVIRMACIQDFESVINLKTGWWCIIAISRSTVTRLGLISEKAPDVYAKTL